MNQPADLFAGAAEAYRRWRPAYPQPVFDWIIGEYALDGTGRLLDGGCGTGQVALPLSRHFADTVAIDPDAGMLRVAMEEARRVGAGTIAFRQMRAEEVDHSLAPLRLATFGASFHWTDRTAVATRLHRMLAPGGGLVILSPPSILDGDQPWKDVLRGTIARWLGPRRRAGSGTYAPRGLHEEHLAATPFPPPVVRTFHDRWSWSSESILGLLESTSFASRAVLGRDADLFAADLCERLLAVAPEDQFGEDVEITVHALRKE